MKKNNAYGRQSDLLEFPGSPDTHPQLCLHSCHLASFILLIAWLGPWAGGFAQDTFKIKLSDQQHGLDELIWGTRDRNYIDDYSVLGELNLTLKSGTHELVSMSTQDLPVDIINHTSENIHIAFKTDQGISLTENFRFTERSLLWEIEIKNHSEEDIQLTDLYFPLPIGGLDEDIPAKENLNYHKSVNGHSSFAYWVPYSGEGEVLLMTMMEGTSLEYFTYDSTYNLYIYSSTAVDSVNDTWRIPSSQTRIPAGGLKQYGFKFQLIPHMENLREALHKEGCLDVRIVPGMTLPVDLTARCAIRVKGAIQNIIAEYPERTRISAIEKGADDYKLFNISSNKLGENLITLHYGKGKIAYLDFFVTEPLETLIKKRSDFITNKQQHRDTSKWYDGLYSIWDMENAELLSPENKQQLPDYVVGGSDDPSNSKPMYVSEKNIVYPDENEIAALEYYEKHFVWGGLQRTDTEYPYPYGIYGSENWYENRSGYISRGKEGKKDTLFGYNSGGLGKERMWRTFDYTTHLAIYYNLYVIARDNPHLVHYLDADGYLERAYRTAMAFFEVPYNIYMGKMWNFNGWTDWAYKQGNFHERYLLDIIEAMEQTGKTEEADALRREWEKKVKYFIYDDPWPFGSEMFVDRTAFESSYYIGEYAKENTMQPQEQLWYDKNKEVWYSHANISDSATDVYLTKQLVSNLALRGVLEPTYYLMGSAQVGLHTLDYMSQMGGAALIDYARKFSTTPYDLINIGYNSMLSSWALMNTGNEKEGYGYWFPNPKNDGAVGWTFAQVQKGTTWWKHIKCKRGAWRYCGEIDHGLTAGIHDLSTIIIDDPVFGMVAYGGVLTVHHDAVKVIPHDGVRRRLYLLNKEKKVFMELKEDGFAKGEAITFSNNLDTIEFTIENRNGLAHHSSMTIQNLAPGNYQLTVNDHLEGNLSLKEEMPALDLQIPLEVEPTRVKLVKSLEN